MPRGRSTFTKRQKEHTRQQRQRDKGERRNQRKQEKAVAGSVDEMAEVREHAAEQAALFNFGAKGESLENALRRFKRKVQTEDIIKEVKRHSYYLKPGERRRVKQALAWKRARKKIRKEGSFAKDSQRNNA